MIFLDHTGKEAGEWQQMLCAEYEADAAEHMCGRVLNDTFVPAGTTAPPSADSSYRDCGNAEVENNFDCFAGFAHQG